MKQTRSTLSFLQSAYKAIFKKAFYLGLAVTTAAVVVPTTANARGGGLLYDLDYVWDVNPGETLTISNSTGGSNINIKKGGSLRVWGSFSGDENNPSFKNGEIKIDRTHTLTIEQGGELVYNRYSCPSKDLNNYLYFNSQIINKGDIIIGSDGYKNPGWVKSLGYIDNALPNVVEQDKWLFKYNDGRGNLILGSNAYLSARGDINGTDVNLNNISLQGISQADIDNRSWHANDTADIYYYYDPSKPINEERLPRFVFNNATANKTFDHEVRVDIRRDSISSFTINADSNNTFTLNKGNFNISSKLIVPQNLNLQIGNRGSFSIWEPNDLKGMNVTIGSTDGNATTGFGEFGVGDHNYTNLNNVTLNKGLFAVWSDNGDGVLQSTGTLKIKHGKDTVKVGEDVYGDFSIASIDPNGKATFAQLNVDTPAITTLADNITADSQISGLHIQSGAQFTVTGTAATGDVNYTDNSIALYTGATLNFNKDAIDTVVNNGVGGLAEGFGTIKAQAGSIISLEFDGQFVIDEVAQNNIKKQLLTGDSVATINFNGGFIDIDLGDKDENGRYQYSKFQELNPDLTTEFTSPALTNNAFTVANDQEVVQHTIGAAHVLSGNTVSVSGAHAGLIGSHANNGFYASAIENGKDIAANIKLAADTTLILQNGGTAKDINLGDKSSLIISGNGANNLDNILGSTGKVALYGNTYVKDSIDVGSLSVETARVEVQNLKNLNNNFYLKNAIFTAKNVDINSAATVNGSGKALVDFGNVNIKGKSITFANDNSSGSPTIVNINRLNDNPVLIINGNINVKGNTFLGLGYKDLDTYREMLQFERYTKNDVVVAGKNGSYLISYDALTLSDNASVLLGTQTQSKSPISYASNSGAVIKFGEDGVLVLDTNAVANDKVGVTFEGGNGKIEAQGGQAKVELAGTIDDSQSYKIFDQSLQVDKDQTIVVSSSNGFYTTTIDKTTDLSQGTQLQLNPNAVANATAGLSTPIQSFLTYALNNPGDITKAGALFVQDYSNNTQQDVFALEKAARLASVSGMASASLGVANANADAINQRLQGNLVAVSTNDNGFSVWFNPIYQNTSVDELESQGLISGADLDFTGANLGVDVQMTPEFLVGVIGSFGSGSSNSTDIGSDVQDDFDYSSFGIYSQFTMNNFYVNGDFSYTLLSNDINANTLINNTNLKTSTDSSVFSVGLEGGYELQTGFVNITPHVGVRYNLLSVDDYIVNDQHGAEIANTKFDDMSFINIPVGVKFDKDFVANDWTIKPSLDLKVAFNTGDTILKYKTQFTGMSKKIKLHSEVLDDLTYGATLGVNAQSGNFGLGCAINYNGSDNYTNFGIQAGVVYKF